MIERRLKMRLGAAVAPAVLKARRELAIIHLRAALIARVVLEAEDTGHFHGFHRRGHAFWPMVKGFSLGLL